MFEKLIVLAVVGLLALLFFGNRLPNVLGDLGKGVRAFKDGMEEGSDPRPKAKAKPKAAARKKPTKASAKKK